MLLYSNEPFLFADFGFSIVVVSSMYVVHQKYFPRKVPVWDVDCCKWKIVFETPLIKESSANYEFLNK
jgi:hypothetical protein